MALRDQKVRRKLTKCAQCGTLTVIYPDDNLLAQIICTVCYEEEYPCDRDYTKILGTKEEKAEKQRRGYDH